TQIADYFGLPRPDLFNANSMLYAIANIAIWEHVGYFMIIYFAALQAIPADFEEAAVVSGARAWQYVIYVKLPLIRGTILVTVIFATIGALQLFAEPYLLEALAPAVITSSYTPNIYAYNLAFVNQDYNYSAAISFVLGAVVAVVSYVFQLISARRESK
ncbi:carbohydrate ABC transporter permease, partial [Devosia sp.]|uniref:carbohydrate ABC transporter permease n=1 Tax=Devosia sp. TaxID=1871048 RepID=UPI001AC72BD0